MATLDAARKHPGIGASDGGRALDLPALDIAVLPRPGGAL